MIAPTAIRRWVSRSGAFDNVSLQNLCFWMLRDRRSHGNLRRSSRPTRRNFGSPDRQPVPQPAPTRWRYAGLELLRHRDTGDQRPTSHPSGSIRHFRQSKDHRRPLERGWSADDGCGEPIFESPLLLLESRQWWSGRIRVRSNIFRIWELGIQWRCETLKWPRSKSNRFEGLGQAIFDRPNVAFVGI